MMEPTRFAVIAQTLPGQGPQEDRETMRGTCLLEVDRIAKRFGGIQALRDVSMTVRAGQIRGLLGANGSGKSTLIKVLAGYHTPDAGRISIGGEQAKLPLDRAHAGPVPLRFVHQDLGLVRSLTVLENLQIDDLVRPRRGWFVSKSAARASASTALSNYEVDLDLDDLVADISTVERAKLAIVRAISGLQHESATASLLVLDEPTVYLSSAATDQLFELIRAVSARGSGVLIVTHDLHEVRQLTTEVTVLRDGSVVGDGVTDGYTDRDLVELITGYRQSTLQAPQLALPAGSRTRALQVRALTGHQVREASFTVDRGEILGLAGLEGSGYDEIPYLLFGALPASTGELTVQDHVVELACQSPASAMAMGFGLVPSNRQEHGLVLSLSVADNLALPVLDELSRAGRIRPRRALDLAAQLCSRFGVQPADPSLPVRTLSGGNQQKVLLAKWLQLPLRLLLLHEPTQGVDVAARTAISRLIRESVRDGMSALVASSDCDELAALCDRVLVFTKGRLSSELHGDSLTAAQIMVHAYGHRSDEGPEKLDGAHA